MKRSSNQGFTLIEILVSAAILVILGVGLLGIQYILGRNQVTAWVSYLAIESTNNIVSTLIRELRGVAPSENGSYPLEVAGDQEIIFYTDEDFDGVAERVRYTLNGTEFAKGIVKPTGDPPIYDPNNEIVKVVSDIIRNDSDPVFYYYNGNWPEDSTNNPLPPADRISDTRYIKIILVANPSPNLPELDYLIESDVNLRTLTE